MRDNVQLLADVLGKTGTILDGVRPDQHGLPTPCAEWTVAQLLEHIAGWMGVFADSAEGGKPEGPAAVDAEGAAKVFAAAADRTVAAFRGGAAERPLTLTSGELPGAAVLGMGLMEYVAHGWDLAVATGQPVPYADTEADAALAAGRQMLRPEYRGPQAIDAEVAVRDDAPALARFLGFVGRDPQWRPPTGG